MNDIQITVIGAGHGGKAMAAELAARDFPVRLYNRTFSHIETIAERGGIALSFWDGHTAFGEIQVATSNLAQAVDGSRVIMVVVPASGHYDVAAALAPHLQDGQIIVLNPGRTGGALEFRQVLRKHQCAADVILAEAETFLFASRSTGPTEAHIFRCKNSLPLAALPACRTQDALAILKQIYPQFTFARNVLYTSLNNMGAVFHPALTLLNAGWIECSQGDFEFYIDGVTPAVARVLERVDRERVTVATAMGIRAQSATDWLARAYSAHGATLHEAIHANPGYKGINAPATVQHRYIFEDVPYSLVPMAAFGRRFGVDVRGIETLIDMACIIHGTDYRHRGRTLERMGLEGLSIEEITQLVETAVIPEPY
ncbi:MAG: NAD/NADP octopine/nopaline dehydrogenase family protein [Anaerolinea sp.]|nr:NAD/NADP octopine/nopaline dehydrogenase family protein [Anaerolinea sp.]